MWCKLKSRVSSENIDALLNRADSFFKLSGPTEILHFGKDFFEGNSLEENNHDVLRLIHMNLWPEIDNNVAFTEPVIDHAILLVKSPGGAATNMHQDRPYWVRKEVTPTLFSVWIALEDMSKDKGGLILSTDTEVDVSDMSTFNKGSVFEHEQVSDGGFPILITDQIASRLSESMEFINLSRGEAIAFDSFEPHMSGANITTTPRLAMKIAYAEGKEKRKYLCRTVTLESI